MNLFQMVLLNTILLLFPMFIYLIYLSTNKNMTNKHKNIYLKLALISSAFLIYDFDNKNANIMPILILNSIIIFSYLEDKYVFANIFLGGIIITYSSYNNILFLLIGYIVIAIIYLITKYKKVMNYIFVELSVIISSVVYYLWIYLYNREFFDVSNILFIIMCYGIIVNIMCLMYEVAKKILQTHLTYKELQQEKQIRLSLFKITHEIKNPIAVCKGYLDMMNVRDSKQVEKYIPIIKSEIERLLTLLQDYLLINKINLDLDIMDFNMLIEDTINKLNPLLKDNNIELNLNIIDDEIFINGDYNKLSQVLINIIKNCIEAIPDDKTGKINISTKIKDNKYYLTIEDNGIGMSKETMNKMKNPFFTTKKRGSGLGVSLVYEIVEAHNGKIEYSSEYGKGTKVTVYLPLYE